MCTLGVCTLGTGAFYTSVLHIAQIGGGCVLRIGDGYVFMPWMDALSRIVLRSGVPGFYFCPDGSRAVRACNVEKTGVEAHQFRHFTRAVVLWAEASQLVAPLARALTDAQFVPAQFAPVPN